MTYDTDNRQIGYEKKKEGTARLNQWSLVSAHKDTSGSTSGLIDEGAIVINTAEGLFPIHVRLHVRLIELDKDDKISECGFKKGEQEIWKSGSTLWMYSRSFIQKSAITYNFYVRDYEACKWEIWEYSWKKGSKQPFFFYCV